MTTGQIEFMTALSSTANGAMLQSSTGEQILLPKEEQRAHVRVAEPILVIVCVSLDGKQYASEKLDQNLQAEVLNNELTAGQEVDGLIYEFSPLGAKVAVNQKFRGLLFQSDIHRDLHIGDQVKLFVHNIRPDGKIDLTLRKPGYKGHIDNSTATILELLREAGGSLPFHDKSDPAEINAEFAMSKKVFKQSIGKLYKQGVIIIYPDHIKLAEK